MKLTVIAFLVCGVMFPAVAHSQQEHKPQQTIDNLNAAIAGEDVVASQLIATSVVVRASSGPPGA